MGIKSIGKFQVLNTLGSGAHSTILHIRRNADSKQYALKVVPLGDPEEVKYQDQARHEFRVGQLFDHPNLIQVHALETVRDWLFRPRKLHLLVEFVNGKTLDQMPALSFPRLVQIFEKVASALVHMHRRNVCHADMKPNNIMLSRAGEVKVLDYGLAWVKGENKDRVQGTPEYMAPEQVKQRLVNERTDIYNFGATMYRLVTWRNAPAVLGGLDGGPVEARAWQKAFKAVQDLKPDCPPPLVKLIHQCLSYNAPQRPERMGEVQGALDHLVDALVRTPDDKLDTLEW